MNRNQFISTLFKEEYPTLIRKAYRLTGSEELAKDLLQDTFVLAIAHYEELVNHLSPGGWLTLTLYNLVRNERRRAKYRDEVPLDTITNLLESQNPMTLSDLLPIQMKEKDKEILVWRYEQQLDYRTIAARLGISEGACRMRVNRLLKVCREILEGDAEKK